jgi:hypothetical protein
MSVREVGNVLQPCLLVCTHDHPLDQVVDSCNRPKCHTQAL